MLSYNVLESLRYQIKAVFTGSSRTPGPEHRPRAQSAWTVRSLRCLLLLRLRATISLHHLHLLLRRRLLLHRYYHRLI